MRRERHKQNLELPVLGAKEQNLGRFGETVPREAGGHPEEKGVILPPRETNRHGKREVQKRTSR